MDADRFHALALDLRRAAAGRHGNPPGISRQGVASLASRVRWLAPYLPHAQADEARRMADGLAGDGSAGLDPTRTLELAAWLERMALFAENARPPLALKAGPNGGDAA